MTPLPNVKNVTLFLEGFPKLKKSLNSISLKVSLQENIKYYQGYDRLKTRSSQLYQNNLTSDSLELEEVGEGQKGPNQYFGFGQKGRGGLQRQVRNHLDEKCFDKAALDLDGYKSNLEAEARVKHV